MLGIALLCIIANLIPLTGWFNADPFLFMSGLGQNMGGGLYPGSPGWNDPTVAYITQPLGYLSAHDWLHFIVPWWNPYSGLGMPLAAEMQASSFFFPFILLLHFHNGRLLLRISLQAMSGIFTYGLLIELGLVRAAALAGAILFALNGTFILDPHAAIAPLPFLPLLLLGIERAAGAATQGRTGGWALVTIAVAYALYAGYPETAYLDGLLAVLWAAWRFLPMPMAGKKRFFGKLALAALIGVGIAAPLVVPFLSYLQSAYIGAHNGLFAHNILPNTAAPLQIFPYIYGPIGITPPAAVQPFLDHAGILGDWSWGQLGDWFGILPAFLALFGAFVGTKQRGLRVSLALFVLFWEARLFGVPGFAFLAAHIPGVASADTTRFIGPALEFAVFTLAAFGIDGFATSIKPISRQTLIIGAAFCIIGVLSILPARHYIALWYTEQPHFLKFTLIWAIWSGVALLVSGLILLSRPTARRAAYLATIVGLDAMAGFMLPQLAGVRHGHADLAGIRYLQAHQGLSRFYTFGPFAPNYGARYGLASLNYSALPVPMASTLFIQNQLFPTADTITFAGDEASQLSAFNTHRAGYEAASIKYLLFPPGANPFVQVMTASIGTARVKPVALFPGQSISGTMPLPASHGADLPAILIEVGTYGGASRGILNVRVCTATDCAIGHGDIANAGDNNYFAIKFEQPLAIGNASSLTYQLDFASGNQVAIWFTTEQGAHEHVLTPAGTTPGLAPLLGLEGVVPAGAPILVFSNPSMNIFKLPNAKPYMAVSGGSCRLKISSRQSATAQCTAPATLIRREVFFPGWQAHINDHPAPISAYHDTFQAINLPAGTSAIRFSYEPPHTMASVIVALISAFVWVAFALTQRRAGNTGALTIPQSAWLQRAAQIDLSKRSRAILPIAFIGLVAPLGLYLALATPPGDVADEPAQLVRAAALLHGTLIGERRVVTTPQGPSVTAGMRVNLAVPRAGFNPFIPLTKANFEQKQRTSWVQPHIFVSIAPLAIYFPIFYVPSAIGLGAGHVIGLSPFNSYFLARLLNLATYLALGLTALISAQRGRTMIFLTLSLPMALSLGASCNPDGLLIATAAVAAAFFTRPRTDRSLIWAGLCIGLVILVKPPYALLALPALLPLPPLRAWVAEHRILLRRLGRVVLICLPGLLWFGYAMIVVAAPVGRLPYHGGPFWPGNPARLFSSTDPAAQLHVLAAQPWGILKLITHSILTNGNLVQEMIGVLGWLDFFLPAPLYTIWMIGAAGALLADLLDPTPVLWSWRDASLIALALAGTMILVWLSQYLDWTNVGLAEVDGPTGRYVLPLLPFIALGLPLIRLPGSQYVRAAATCLPILAAAVTLIMLPHAVALHFQIR
ncbi:MAG: hypothetical protein B7Z78_09125 [Rhodospirillales bacterium 20-60-12]|nr:MAG: hypothetical protein B7Z78_09125 [Rhodospirillales bacterium 20-60-12]HQT65987.1 DUF2142 domain-containing protein [Acetobacteraceae bacterium]